MRSDVPAGPGDSRPLKPLPGAQAHMAVSIKPSVHCWGGQCGPGLGPRQTRVRILPRVEHPLSVPARNTRGRLCSGDLARAKGGTGL